jgi:hypothetical protein
MNRDVPSSAEPGPELLSSLLRIIPEWHPVLAQDLARALERGIAGWKDIDDLLTQVTKEVDDRFRSLLEERTGAKFPKLTLDRLISEAVGRGIVSSQTTEWYALKGFTGGPRNTAHHRFSEYPAGDITRCLLEADFLLHRIDEHRNERQVAAHYSVAPVPGQDAIRFTVHTSGLLPEVQGFLRTEAGPMKKDIPLLSPGQDRWEGTAFARDYHSETITARFIGNDQSGTVAATSGTVITLSSILPNWGKSVAPGSAGLSQ